MNIILCIVVTEVDITKLYYSNIVSLSYYVIFPPIIFIVFLTVAHFQVKIKDGFTMHLTLLSQHLCQLATGTFILSKQGSLAIRLKNEICQLLV